MDNNNQQPKTVEYVQTEKRKEKGKGLAITSLVFGVLSLLSFWVIYISVPSMIIGFVASVNALKKRTAYKGMAIAGIVSSSISLSIMLVLIVVFALFGMTRI